MRERIQAAATRLVRQKGFVGLSVRNLAAALEMSIGTIYNYFVDIHEIILTINEQTIAMLSQDLAAAHQAKPGGPGALVDAYFDFLEKHKKRWRLLFEYYPPPGHTMPASYEAAIETAVTLVNEALFPQLGDLPEDDRRDITVGLWAMLHGLSMLDQQGKLRRISANHSLRQIAHATVNKALNVASASQSRVKQETK